MAEKRRNLAKFGVDIDPDLRDRFIAFLDGKGMTNRSGMTKLIEFFLSCSPEAQQAILGLRGEQAREIAASVIQSHSTIHVGTGRSAKG